MVTKPSSDDLTADVELGGPGWRLRVNLTVPKRKTSLRQVLPMVQSLADAVVDQGVQTAAKEHEPISCKRGCGACCRQLVPIAEVEARRLEEVIQSFPEARRQQVRDRFAEARRRLGQAGLLEKLQNAGQWSDSETRPLGLAYFGLGIPCPFLDEESCSIYSDRPIACREYLVTSPPDNCAHPSADSVRCLKLPLKVSTALHRCEDEVPRQSLRWVPLILAPEWATEHPEEPERLPGPQWVEKLIGNLTGKEIPASLPASTSSPRT
jgi:Fe-S-cluster containining protein